MNGRWAFISGVAGHGRPAERAAAPTRGDRGRVGSWTSCPLIQNPVWPGQTHSEPWSPALATGCAVTASLTVGTCIWLCWQSAVQVTVTDHHPSQPGLISVRPRPVSAGAVTCHGCHLSGRHMSPPSTVGRLGWKVGWVSAAARFARRGGRRRKNPAEAAARRSGRLALLASRCDVSRATAFTGPTVPPPLTNGHYNTLMDSTEYLSTLQYTAA